MNNSDGNLKFKIDMKIVIFFSKDLIESVAVTVNIKLCIITSDYFRDTDDMYELAAQIFKLLLSV